MTSIILWILIPIAILTAILLSVLLYSSSIKRRKTKLLEDLDFEIKKERMVKMDAIINRVRIISDMNVKFRDLFDELTNMHTELKINLNEALNLLGGLILQQRKMNIIAFDRKVERIRTGIKNIDTLQHNFEIKAERITQQDEFMGAEIGFYTNNLRKTITVYRQKRILLSKISNKLDDSSKNIKELEKSFHEELDKANIKNANNILNEYSNSVAKFSKIVNEGPAIESYIYKTIPSLVKSIMVNYKAKKEEVGGVLDHINFAKTIQNIGDKYKEAKKYYLNLEIDKAKKDIRSILKSLKILERLINLEIESRNIYIDNLEDIITATEKSLRIFGTIKEQIEDLGGKGIQIPVNLIERYAESLNDSRVLEQMLSSFVETSNEKDTAYSTKMQKMKLLTQKNIYFIGVINEVTASIWSLNAEKLIIKNKFRKAEGALSEIVSSTKKDKLIFTPNESKEFEELSHELSKLAPSIAADESSKELTEMVNNVVSKVINYYQVVGGKIQIAEIIRNLLKELGPRRALDIELNSQLGSAETHYLRGEYDAALNLIITHLEEEM